MIRYDLECHPPAPIVDGEVINPYLGHSEKTKALIDTGADLTLIPTELVEGLKLVPAGTVMLRPIDGEDEERRAYFVHMTFQGMRFEWIRVSFSTANEFVLGRDVLNRMKILLDGKNLSFEVEDP